MKFSMDEIEIIEVGVLWSSEKYVVLYVPDMEEWQLFSLNLSYRM